MNFNNKKFVEQNLNNLKQINKMKKEFDQIAAENAQIKNEMIEVSKEFHLNFCDNSLLYYRISNFSSKLTISKRNFSKIRTTNSKLYLFFLEIFTLKSNMLHFKTPYF